MRRKNKTKQSKKSKQARFLPNTPPSLHLFTQGKSNHGPYFDIEFLKNYKYMLRKKLSQAIDVISPTTE
jgi:hypothetical protein